MNIKNQVNSEKMPILQHLEELRKRALFSFIIFITITFICFIKIKQIIYILQEPAIGIKFLQLAPGEYLFSSIKVAIYTGSVLSIPFTIYQIMQFIIPGLTPREIKYIIPILISSIILFIFGIFFSYKILAPAAIQFFIQYGGDIIEPIWSLEEYFNFILLLIFSTGISFQIPIIQILLGIANIMSSTQMLTYWKYIIFIATILGAIITPSTDPITQIFTSTAIIMLYFLGCIILKFLNK
uniref:Sec-independent translocase component C n=1 Tax=Ceramothamnion japonicum TaxID=218448 RepID=A0A1C9CD58_CERJP|nr:Sec-independent translocase component C [Ceramium japonicum]AOM66302.1 Sec-independent translocase component C [Ceramium japonicum]